MLRLTVAIAAALAASSPAAVMAQEKAATAATSPARSAENVELDSSRKPTEVLQFLGLKPGMHVLDLFGGNRYWAEIVAPAVGPNGQVTVWEPTQFYSPETKAEFEAFAAKSPNVSIVTSPFESADLPANYADFVMLNLDYHDTYWQSEKYKIPRMEPADFLKRLYAAVKPGGIVGVIDHVALPSGDTRATVEKLHRIDPAVVKSDFEKAGFVLEGESELLRNPADDHSKNVFDPAIRGKTDRFIFKFVKPAK